MSEVHDTCVPLKDYVDMRAAKIEGEVLLRSEVHDKAVALALAQNRATGGLIIGVLGLVVAVFAIFFRR